MFTKMERAPDVVWRKIDDDAVIIKEDGTELITLNSTAALIWEKCDGVTDVKDITTIMQEQFTTNFEEIYSDVIAVLKRLEDMNLLKRADE